MCIPKVPTEKLCIPKVAALKCGSNEFPATELVEDIVLESWCSFTIHNLSVYTILRQIGTPAHVIPVPDVRGCGETGIMAVVTGLWPPRHGNSCRATAKPSGMV